MCTSHAPPSFMKCQSICTVTIPIPVQADLEWHNGNHQGAYDAARNARSWGIIGIITGFLGFFFAVMLMIVIIIYTT